MKCPRCSGTRTFKIGNGGRGACHDCRHAGRIKSFQITADMEIAFNEARIRALAGSAPEFDVNHPVPPGFGVKGVSTYYNEDGKPTGQWIKTDRDSEIQREMFEAAVKAYAEKLPREKPRKAPTSCIDQVLNLYVLTDYHLGMLAWGEETGADWDLKIAEDMVVAWICAALAQSPKAKVGIFAQLGDFLHWDGMDAVTPQSKHLLDADGRFQKLVRVAIRVIRRVIGMMLERHEHVHVIQAEGNHDPASSIWLREWTAAIFENEPRVTVDLSPDPYYCYEWGSTSLFFHHGHKRKPTNIDDVFAAKFREVFGRTKHSYAHMGHLHHIDVKETSLMVVEQHRTLAAPDAYASRGGWLSGRDAQVISYHKQFGEVGRNRVSSLMLA